MSASEEPKEAHACGAGPSSASSVAGGATGAAMAFGMPIVVGASAEQEGEERAGETPREPA